MNQKKFLISGGLISLFLAGVISFYASSSPDGLEKVADDIGFIDSAKDHAVGNGVLADYSVKGIENGRVSGGLAGVAGVLITGGIAYVLFIRVAKKK